MKVYKAEEVADIVRLDSKTIRRLVKRGVLKALPGIRHIRITEQELNRYLDVRSVMEGVFSKPPVPTTLAAAPPPASGKPTKPAESNKNQPTKGKSV